MSVRGVDGQATLRGCQARAQDRPGGSMHASREAARAEPLGITLGLICAARVAAVSLARAVTVQLCLESDQEGFQATVQLGGAVEADELAGEAAQQRELLGW